MYVVRGMVWKFSKILQVLLITVAEDVDSKPGIWNVTSLSSKFKTGLVGNRTVEINTTVAES